MDDRALLSLLQSLAQLDIDACHSYRRVVERVQDENVRRQLLEFWREHERHVDELAAAIHRRGGTPPDFERDTAGIVIEGFTRLRAATGIGGALRALKTNERLTNAAYAAAMKERVPDEVRDLLERNRADEQHHLDYIRDVLARPEHRGAGLGPVLAGAALVTAGAAAAVWAVGRWRARPAPEPTPEPEWRVRKAPSGARQAEAPAAERARDFGDEAQLQGPGRPENLAIPGGGSGAAQGEAAPDKAR